MQFLLNQSAQHLWEPVLSWFLDRAEASFYFHRQFPPFRYGSGATCSLPQHFRILAPCEVSFAAILHLHHLNGKSKHLEQAFHQTPPPALPLSNPPFSRSEFPFKNSVYAHCVTAIKGTIRISRCTHRIPVLFSLSFHIRGPYKCPFKHDLWPAPFERECTHLPWWQLPNNFPFFSTALLSTTKNSSEG